MSKYIDAEAFREEMDNHFPFDKYTQDHEPLLDLAKSRIIRLLAIFPSADVEPVRHGHWAITHPPKYIRLDRRTDMMECSECGHQIFRKTGEIVNYCPNCGARMIREE